MYIVYLCIVTTQTVPFTVWHWRSAFSAFNHSASASVTQNYHSLLTVQAAAIVISIPLQETLQSSMWVADKRPCACSEIFKARGLSTMAGRRPALLTRQISSSYYWPCLCADTARSLCAVYKAQTTDKQFLRPVSTRRPARCACCLNEAVICVLGRKKKWFL